MLSDEDGDKPLLDLNLGQKRDSTFPHFGRTASNTIERYYSVYNALDRFVVVDSLVSAARH